MRKTWTAAVLVLVVIASGISIANKASDGEGMCITISPNTLVLSRDGGSISVHSNIAIGLVDRSSLLLEGVAPYLTKADSLGHLVAKFSADPIKAELVPGQATLTLTGMLKNGEELVASDTITVRK